MTSKIMLPKKDDNGEYYLSYSQVKSWQELKGFNIGHITTPAERFSTVHTWYEETERVWTFLAPYLSQIK